MSPKQIIIADYLLKGIREHDGIYPVSYISDLFTSMQYDYTTVEPVKQILIQEKLLFFTQSDNTICTTKEGYKAAKKGIEAYYKQKEWISLEIRILKWAAVIITFFALIVSALYLIRPT